MKLRAVLGEAIRAEPNASGDLWATTWASDGNVYAAVDDTRGIDGSCSSNLAIYRLEGDDEPAHAHPVLVNPMSEYGEVAEVGPDGAHWKASSLICVDGVLYLTVSRHYFLSTSPYAIQTAWDASIVKSDDLGRTWSPRPEFGQSMFPGHNFGAPSFIQYGRDGVAEVDGADAYVYAVSSDGVWNNGSSMVLGRVRRERIEALEAKDWEFVQGLDEAGTPRWGARHDTAMALFRNPGRTSMSGIHHIAPLGVYVLPQWHYVDLGAKHPARWQSTQWEFFEAEVPWGPWSRFHVQQFTPQGFYNPSIPAKYIGDDGTNLWVTTAGDFITKDYYWLYLMPLTLHPRERVSAPRPS